MPITVTRAGQTYGPYSIEELHRYVVSGNILPTDLAVSDDHPEPRSVAELLAQAPPPTGLPPAAWNDPQAQQPGYTQTSYPQPGYAQPGYAQPGYAQPGYAQTGSEYPWFPVSSTKFIVMSFCTFGLYNVYWAYKQWDRQQRQTGEATLPWARGLFLGIFNFSLFQRVKTRAALEGDAATWNPVLLAILVIVIGACARLPRGLSIISLFSFLPYLPVVNTIVKANARHAGTVSEAPNSHFSGANIAGIVIGGIFLLLALLGFVMQLAGIAKR